MEQPNKRVDLVLWNGNGTPRAIIEVKRSDTIAGIVADGERLTDFVKYAGRAYGGSVRYGLLATLFQHPVGSSPSSRTQKVMRRYDALSDLAQARGFRLRSHGPRAVHLGALRTYCEVETVVFEFSRSSGD